MRRSEFARACLAILTIVSSGLADAAPRVRSAEGWVQGSVEQGVATFRGIPYAAPPTGEWRWRPPRAVTPWTGTRDATAFGPICPQPSLDGTPIAADAISEDCLTINVWTPARHTRNAKLPVMVWIHGGAFFVGSSAQWLDQGPSDLARNDIVLVSFNYRIGRLGFFAHPAFTAAHPGEPIANYWLMDQVAALQWVARNIAAFGGDPANVTIFGVSAGGSSVNALVATPKAKGLFAKAIAQSGGGLMNAGTSLDDAEQNGVEFASRLGVEATDASAAAKLREFTPAQILAAERGPPTFNAMYDGTYLASSIASYFVSGAANDVPYIAGTTSNEFSVFAMMGLDAEKFRQRFDVDLASLRSVYERSGPITDAELVRQAGTDAIFTTGAHGLARLASRSGVPAYTYQFAYLPAAKRGVLPGVPHGGDQPYLFGVDYRFPGASMPKPSSEDRDIAAIMQGYWVNFARSGDPNGPGLPPWPAYDLQSPQTLVIDETTRAVPRFREGPLQAWFEILEHRLGVALP